jgi:FkbM family methyltransferase
LLPAELHWNAMNLKQTAQRAFATLGLHVERIDPTPEALKDHLRILQGQATTIIDGGANCGDFSLLYASLFPAARIHAFEPGENVQATLRQAVAGQPRISVHPLGLAESTGQRSFELCSNSLINSLLPPSAGLEALMGSQKVRRVQTTTINTITVDDFCQRNGIERVDVLKLDIQGAELLAIQGAERILASHAVKLLYTEANFKRNQYEGQASFDDVWRHLETKGYRLFRLYNLTSGADMFLGFGDAIFVSPEVAASISRESFHRF